MRENDNKGVDENGIITCFNDDADDDKHQDDDNNAKLMKVTLTAIMIMPCKKNGGVKKMRIKMKQ